MTCVRGMTMSERTEDNLILNPPSREEIERIMMEARIMRGRMVAAWFRSLFKPSSDKKPVGGGVGVPAAS